MVHWRFSLLCGMFSIQISCLQRHHKHLVSSQGAVLSEEICGGNGISLGDWPSLLCTSCLHEDVSRPMSAPYAWYCTAASSSALTPPSVCLHVITAVWHLPPLPSPCPFLSPSPRFTHPSRCQALVRSGSPLAPWLRLPSNNFISFQPLSRRHAPPLTIGCCFITVGKKRRRDQQGRLRTQQ